MHQACYPKWSNWTWCQKYKQITGTKVKKKKGEEWNDSLTVSPSIHPIWLFRWLWCYEYAHKNILGPTKQIETCFYIFVSLLFVVAIILLLSCDFYKMSMLRLRTFFCVRSFERQKGFQHRFIWEGQLQFALKVCSSKYTHNANRVWQLKVAHLHDIELKSLEKEWKEQIRRENDRFLAKKGEEGKWSRKSSKQKTESYSIGGDFN